LVALGFTSSEQFADEVRFAADSRHALLKPPPAMAVKTPRSARLSSSTELSSMKVVLAARAGSVSDVDNPYRG